MRTAGSIGIAAAVLAMAVACGSGDSDRSDDARSTRAPSEASATSSSSRPSVTPRTSASPPSATATLDPQPVLNECEPVTDQGVVSQLAATVLPPWDDPTFALNGVVGLRTTYEGDSWTYLAARIGPTIDGALTTVAVWALPDGQPPVGVQWAKDTDGDQRLDLENKIEGVLSPTAETGPYFWNNDRTRVAACVLGAPSTSSVKTRMTMADYQQLIPESTTLDQLYALVGDRACDKSSESSIGGFTTVGLTCRGEGQPGANAVLIFQNNVLVSKAQAGLS
jgi:hypothetical protein